MISRWQETLSYNKLLLYVYKMLSGLNFFPKSEVFMINDYIDNLWKYAELLFLSNGLRVNSLLNTLGVDNIANSIQQCWNWFIKWLSNNKRMHFFTVAICWSIWKYRKAWFDKKIIKRPCEVITKVCSVLIFWAGLFKEGIKKKVAEGANLLLWTALQ